jgi:hypothetical protein
VAALTFYFDRNFGKRFPEALALARPPFTVEYHHSKKNNFPQSMTDDLWLEICGKNGWFAFSHDQKFHANLVEAMAIKQHNVGAFYLPGGSLPTWEKVCYFIRAFPQIVALARLVDRPFLYKVRPTSRIVTLP